MPDMVWKSASRRRLTPNSASPCSRGVVTAGLPEADLIVWLVYGRMGTPFDLSQTDKLLTTTRAVRKRLDLTRPVPRQLVLDCIQVATQAPAGGNVQRWRWLLVDD